MFRVTYSISHTSLISLRLINVAFQFNDNVAVVKNVHGLKHELTEARVLQHKAVLPSVALDNTVFLHQLLAREFSEFLALENAMYSRYEPPC